MTLSERVHGMAQKLQTVAEHLQTLRAENSALQQTNRELNDRLAAAATALEKAHAAKPEDAGQKRQGVDAPQPEPDEKLREQIEHYIAEIDKCIDWLRNN
jgi:regulator of replication initiation timing